MIELKRSTYPRRYEAFMRAIAAALAQRLAITNDAAMEAVEHAMDVMGDPSYHEDPPEHPMDLARAIGIANLWRAGKMIGGSEDDVRDALLAEVERLHSGETEYESWMALLRESLPSPYSETKTYPAYIYGTLPRPRM